MGGEYITIQRYKWELQNPPLNHLYVSSFTKVYKNIAKLNADSLPRVAGDIENLDKLLFCRENLKAKVSVNDYRFSRLIDLNKIQDITGEPVVVKEYDIIVYDGNYYDKNGSKTRVFFWLNDGEIVFMYENKERRIPLSEVYVLSHEGRSVDDPAQFRRLDYIHAEVMNETFKEFEDAELILDLSLRIAEINDIFSEKFNTLIAKSKERVNNFERSKLLDEININCIGGTFTFYPILIPFSFTIESSLFNITSWERDSLTLNYDVEDVENLFHIFLRDKLPKRGDLVKSGLISLYAELCEYIGIEFYADYFATITQTIEYRTLTIPVRGSVDDYLTFLRDEPLELQYEKFSPRVNDKNFYVAMHEKGLSSSYMVKDSRMNPSHALQEFVEEHY